MMTAALASSCRGSPRERCLAAMREERYAAAAPLCRGAFDARGDHQLGVAAARALWELERDDEVLALVDVLDRGPHAAGARYLRGRIALGRGQRELGLAELEAALDADRAAGRHLDAARDAAALADGYWRASRHRQAIAAAETVRTEALAVGDARWEAWALIELGDLWADVGDRGRAAQAFREAEARRPPTAPGPRAALQLKRALLELRDGNLELARRGFTAARQLAGEAGDVDQRLAAHINLAEVAWQQQRFDEAGAELAAARAATPRGAPPLHALLFNEARLALQLGQLDAAGGALDEAERRDALPTWAWRIAHLRGRLAEARAQLARDPAEAHRLLAAAAAAYQQAVAIVEELRGELGEHRLKARFLDERRRAHEALFALAVRRGDQAAALAAAEGLLARTFVDAFVASAAAGTPPLERVTAVPELVRALGASPVATPRPPAQLLSALREVFALVYVEAQDQLYAVVVSGGQARPLPLALSAPQVAALARRVRANPDDDALQVELGDALLPDSLGPLPDGPLYVVPSGPVAGVAFAALRRRGAPLLARHELAVVPSLGVLAQLLQAPAPPAGPPVVLGDPRGDLPAARAEAISVARTLGVTAQLGARATRAELWAGRTASVLHLATHSAIGPAGASLTLSDTSVSAAEIFAAGLHPRLAVLASCASAVTDAREFWGALGTSFLASGSRSVVASLWSVDDALTAELIDAFYRNGGAARPAAALARAQRELAAHHPASAWAAFTLLGAAGASKDQP
ncbi:MAG: CHAT domain-containing protein [Kofleriaceae bacterium]